MKNRKFWNFLKMLPKKMYPYLKDFGNSRKVSVFHEKSKILKFSKIFAEKNVPVLERLWNFEKIEYFFMKNRKFWNFLKCLPKKMYPYFKKWKIENFDNFWNFSLKKVYLKESHFWNRFVIQNSRKIYTFRICLENGNFSKFKNNTPALSFHF